MINELIIISAIVLFVDQMAAFLSRVWHERVQSVDLLIMHVYVLQRQPDKITCKHIQS